VPGGELRGDRLCQPGLADPAGARDRDDDMTLDQLADCDEVVRAPI